MSEYPNSKPCFDCDSGVEDDRSGRNIVCAPARLLVPTETLLVEMSCDECVCCRLCNSICINVVEVEVVLEDEIWHVEEDAMVACRLVLSLVLSVVMIACSVCGVVRPSSFFVFAWMSTP